MQTLQQALFLSKHAAAMGRNDYLQPNPAQCEEQVAAHDLGLRSQNRHTYIPKEVHHKEHYLDQIKSKQGQWQNCGLILWLLLGEENRFAQSMEWKAENM